MNPASDPSSPAARVDPPEATARLLTELARALEAQTFVKLTLSKPRKGAADEDRPLRAVGRLVEIRGEPMLSLVLSHKTRDITRNHPLAEAPDAVWELLSDSLGEAYLFTTAANLELRTNKRGTPRFHQKAATFEQGGAPQAHNRPRNYILEASKAPYLQELGIVDGKGRVRDSKQGKFRQLQNFIRVLDPLVTKAGLRDRERLRVVDIGCGKAYLTFALHDYCNQVLGIPTEVVGIDQNADLVTFNNGVVARLGLQGLTFTHSTAEEHPTGAADIVVALHACDTATDDALFAGLAADAALIIAVPCCQKELRPQFQVPADELPLFRHDTFKDRYTQMLTDSLRSLLLESQGYTSRVVEFISDSHTHRNVMIQAIKGDTRVPRDKRRAEADALMARYGIDQHRLNGLLAAQET